MVCIVVGILFSSSREVPCVIPVSSKGDSIVSKASFLLVVQSESVMFVLSVAGSDSLITTPTVFSTTEDSSSEDSSSEWYVLFSSFAFCSIIFESR